MRTTALIAILLALFMGVTLTACPEEEGLNAVKEDVEEAGEEAKDAAEEAGEEAKDAAEDATE